MESDQLGGGRKWVVLMVDERSLKEVVERLCGGEEFGCLGVRVGEEVGRFERREKVVWRWFSGVKLGGVGEMISRRIFGCVPVEMVGGISRIPGPRRDFVRAKVSDRKRGYRCRRDPGAWGLARPSSPVSDFARFPGSVSDRTRQTTGGPVSGEDNSLTTSHGPLAQTVLKQRSIEVGFGDWFLEVCRGEARGR